MLDPMVDRQAGRQGARGERKQGPSAGSHVAGYQPWIRRNGASVGLHGASLGREFGPASRDAPKLRRIGEESSTLTCADSFTRLLGGLRCAIEKVYHTRPQTVLGSDDQQPVVLNQALEDGRPVAQMVRRSPNVRTHGVCDEGLRLLAKRRGQQGLHGGPDAIDNRPQTSRLMKRGLA